MFTVAGNMYNWYMTNCTCIRSSSSMFLLFLPCSIMLSTSVLPGVFSFPLLLSPRTPGITRPSFIFSRFKIHRKLLLRFPRLLFARTPSFIVRPLIVVLFVPIVLLSLIIFCVVSVDARFLTIWMNVFYIFFHSRNLFEVWLQFYKSNRLSFFLVTNWLFHWSLFTGILLFGRLIC
uniref:Uncharacterized protein n=2 Tax=Cacopsylla melanoneura TaxID=428564 RepID=A0A8D8ZAL4_9HEMI